MAPGLSPAEKRELVKRSFEEVNKRKKDFLKNPKNAPIHIQNLMDLIRKRTQLDLSYYRDTYIQRRVMYRLSVLEIESYQDYVGYLRTHPEEFPKLQKVLTIHTTEWFRDQTPFEYLRKSIIPALIQEKKKQSSNQTIRILSAPSSSGQEPYTLAMIVEELLRTHLAKIPIEIYGCDLEKEILDKARMGQYPSYAMKGLPNGYQEKYFKKVGEDDFQIITKLKRRIKFFKQDLFHPLPAWLKPMDIVLCRNLLIYISREHQKLVLKHLEQVLRPNGYMMLGKTESLLIFNPKGYKNENAREHIYRYIGSEKEK